MPGHSDFDCRQNTVCICSKCMQGKQQHLLILCEMILTLWISWISEMQQKAAKHSKTQHTQDVSTIYSLWCLRTVQLEKSFSSKSFAWRLVFFLSWMSKFSLYCCLAHTSAVTQPKKNTEKMGKCGLDKQIISMEEWCFHQNSKVIHQ